MNILQNTYQILFKPNEAFDELIENYNLNVFLQGLIIFIAANLIANKFSLTSLFGPTINLLFLSFYIFLTAYVFVLRGKDFFKLLGLLAFSALPLIFTEVLNILSFDIGSFQLLFKLLVLIWIFKLQLIVITKVCKVSEAKATLIYMIVPLAIAFFFALSIMKLIIGLIT